MPHLEVHFFDPTSSDFCKIFKPPIGGLGNVFELGGRIWRGSTAGKNFSSDEKKSQTIHLKTLEKQKKKKFDFFFF